jgi:hypothetical protein
MGRPKGSKNKPREPKIRATGGSEGRGKYTITYTVHDLETPYEVMVSGINNETNAELFFRQYFPNANIINCASV